MTNARELTAQLADLLRREHHAMADFLVALAEFDRRRLWLDLGYTGLFPFLHRELGLSKAAAYFRKPAAELVQRFPEVVEPLRDGRLCLTAVVELAKVVRPENHADVLPRFFHCSKREAKEVSAALSPVDAPPRRDGHRGRAPCPPHAGSDRRGRSRRDGVARGSSGRTDLPRRDHASRRADTFARGEARRSRAAHRRSAPAPRHGLEAVPRKARRREGSALALAPGRDRRGDPGGRPRPRPRAAREAQGARREAAEAAPAVEAGARPCPREAGGLDPDGGRCQFRLENGEICGSTVRLELDHVRPRARGGPPTIENVRLACRPHNQLAARRAFGDAWMDGFTRGARQPARPAGAGPPVAAPRPRL